MSDDYLTPEQADAIREASEVIQATAVRLSFCLTRRDAKRMSRELLTLAESLYREHGGRS